MRNLIFTIFLAVLFSACARVITSKTQYDPVKYSSIGYIAFKLEDQPLSVVSMLNNETNIYDLMLRNCQSKEDYEFMLNDEMPNSINLFVGPFAVYKKYLGSVKTVPLKLIPIPEGKYVVTYIYQDLLRGRRGWFASGDTIKIEKDKMTYIGTYSITPKHFLIFPYGIEVNVRDDGAERANQMKLSNEMITQICKIRK